MRKTRLDEVPQLVNVVRGDMSFVGPRPERPHFVSKLREVIPYYDERHSVRPGITGWAQVKFPYGSTIEDAEEKLEYDLFYVKHMSLLLDAAIILETAKVMLLGRGRWLVPLPAPVHRVRQHEVARAESGERRVAFLAERLAQGREVLDVVADVGHDLERRQAVGRRAARDRLEARVLVARVPRPACTA